MSAALADKSRVASIAVAAPRMEIEHIVKLAGGELQGLLTQRAAILRRLAILRRIISGLAEMFGDDVLPEDVRALIKLPTQRTRGVGLTEACRTALSTSSRPLTAREVVDTIRAKDAKVIQNHKDPVASVTSILHRLGSYGEATTEVSQSGRRMWAPVEVHRHNYCVGQEAMDAKVSSFPSQELTMSATPPMT
jgi:hypothetical protein